MEKIDNMEGGSVLLEKASPRPGKAGKGLGPSRDRAVGVLPALTPVRPQEPRKDHEPMEVVEIPGWLLSEEDLPSIEELMAPQVGEKEQTGSFPEPWGDLALS